MDYRNHLMIKKTDRNRNSFYWEYDKYEEGARAVRSWGDGGVLSLWIDYHDDEMYNAVRTGKDKKASEYHYNEQMLCTRRIDPDLTQIRENYDDKYRLTGCVDEEGRLTSYQYNGLSQLTQLTQVTQADGSTMVLSYDEDGRLVRKQNPAGDCVEWYYNADDTLQKTIDETGAETAYDKHWNLSRVTLPNGSAMEWEYDDRGNCISSKNALGAVEAYTYDKLNRLIKAKAADGNEVSLTYNAYEEVIHAKDRHTEIDFTYSILGSMTSRTQARVPVQQ